MALGRFAAIAPMAGAGMPRAGPSFAQGDGLEPEIQEALVGDVEVMVVPQ